MFNFPNCRDCNATLPIATGICPHCTQLSPAPAQQSQSDSVAAPAEVGQGLGTITCAACGSTNIYSYPYTSEFCQCVCDDCDSPLNADGSVWVEKQEPTLEQFQRWLEDKAHAAHAEYFTGPKGETLEQEIDRCRPITALLSRTRIATELLMLFMQERRA